MIDLARRGEEVVIIRDSRPVAALSPIDPQDLELATGISDRQARLFHQWIDKQPKTSLRDARAAARFLEKDMARKEGRKRR